jgi:hypothetical protein
MKARLHGSFGSPVYYGDIDIVFEDGKQQMSVFAVFFVG